MTSNTNQSNTNTTLSNNSLKSSNDEYYLEDPNKISVDHFITILLRRIQSVPLLNSQLSYLQKNLKIIPEILA